MNIRIFRCVGNLASIKIPSTSSRKKRDAEYWTDYQIPLPASVSDKYNIGHLSGSVLNLYSPGGYQQTNQSQTPAGEKTLQSRFLDRGLIQYGSKYYEKFRDNFSHLSHLLNPQMESELILKCHTFFNGWTFLHDDVMDNLLDHRSGEFSWEVVDKANQVFCGILRDQYGRDYEDNFPADIEFPLFKELAHTWKDFHALSHANIPEYSARNHYFVKYMIEYFNSYILVHGEKINRRFSEETGKYWLRFTTGAKPWVELLLLVRGVVLSQEMRKDFYFIRCRTASEDVIGAINDVFGVAKDLINDETDTLVMFKHKEKNVPLEDAYQYALDFLNEQMRDIKLLLEILRKRYPNDPMVDMYGTTLEDFVSGYIIWCASNRRYLGKTKHSYRIVNQD